MELTTAKEQIKQLQSQLKEKDCCLEMAKEETAAKMARQKAELLALKYALEEKDKRLQIRVNELCRAQQVSDFEYQANCQAIEDLKTRMDKMEMTNRCQQETARKMTQATCLYSSQENDRGLSTDLLSTERVQTSYIEPQGPPLATPVQPYDTSATSIGGVWKR